MKKFERKLGVSANWFKTTNSPKTFYLELLSTKQKRAKKFKKNKSIERIRGVELP